MRQSLFRYLPLLLLAIAWEVVARLELVSTSALPPLSEVISAGAAMVKDGELITNGASSLYRAVNLRVVCYKPAAGRAAVSYR